MPDQYTLEHFRRTELAPRHRAPVMAEIDLISSHHTWTPIPQLIRWRDVGDGAAFSAQPGDAAEGGVGDAATVRRHYRDALSYTWHTLISFLETYPDPDRIFILVGDHQPHAVVTGDSVGRDVPVTVLSQDADLVRAFASRQWQRGLHPGPNAPVWRMDEFRDRWFSAYSAPAC